MKQEKNIRVVIVEPLREPREAYIENELHTLQKNVGGYIECISLADGIDLVLNEEGKLIGLKPNRGIWPDENGKYQDIVFGTFMCCGVDESVGEFRSLTDDEFDYCMDRFNRVELWTIRGT